MKLVFAAVLLALSVVSACGPDEPEPELPPDVCPEAVVVDDNGFAFEQPTSTSTVPDASCGTGGVALFTFTPQRSGSYRVIGRDADAIPDVTGIWTTHDDPCGAAESCTLASSTVVRDLDAGETIHIGARVDDDVVSLTVVPVAVVIDGAACDEISRFCAADSACVNEICVGDDPVFLCSDFTRVEGETTVSIQLGNISVPTSDCGVSSVAATGAVRWVAPRAGVMSVEADNDATRISVHRGGCDVRESLCGIRGIFGGLEVDAGEVIFIAVESTNAQRVELTFDLLNPVALDEACNPFIETCTAGECVSFSDEIDAVDASDDGQRCRLVEARGTCASPKPVAIDEVALVAADPTLTVPSPCDETAEGGGAVFSFTAPEDLVLLPDVGAIVTTGRCNGAVLSSLCTARPVSMRAGDTVFLEHRYTRHGYLSSLLHGVFPVIRFAPHVVDALDVGDDCDAADVDSGVCAFGASCVQGVCRRD